MKLRKSSRFVSLVLSAVMVLAMLPGMSGTAEAAGIKTRNIPLDLTKNEVFYTATDGSTKNASPTITSITDTNEGWSWDFPNKTLTLSGANMDCSGKTYGNSESALSVPDGTKIVLTAGSVNTAKGPNVNASGYGSWGVYGLGQLTISGEGTLNATGGTAITGSYGIEVVNPGKFLYIDGGTINATGLSAATSYGIDGRSEVRGGTGSATGTTRGFFKMPRGTIGSSLINYQDKTVRWPAVPIIFFDTRNGVYIDSAEIANSTITMPSAPTWKDYTFAGWYTGIDGAGTVFANSGLSAKQTVYAKWTKGGKTVRTEALKLTDPASTNPGDQGWTWDYGTLTLDGLLLDHSAGTGEANGEIALPHGATVVVSGTNRVIGGAADDGVGVATVATNAYFTIQGSGTLDVVADRIGIAALEGGSLTISGATVNAEARLSRGAGLGAAFTLTIKSGATVSAKGDACAIMGETGGIIATDALVTGAKEPFESGTTKMLTQSGTGPVTIGFTPPPVGAHYDVVGGTGSGSRLERSLNKVVTDTNKGVTAADNAEGNKVSLKLTVTETATTATEIEGVRQGDSVQYYDVTVRKTVTTPAGNKTITTLTSIPMPVQAIIPVPADIQGKTSYTVYRIHGGMAEKIPHDPTAPEFYTVDAGGKSLTLNVNKFSTYAVITSNKALTGDATFGDAKNPKSSAVDVQGKVIEGMFGVYKLDISWGAMKFDYNAQGKVWNPVTHVYDATGTKGWIKECFETGNNKITVANHSNGDVTLSYTATADAILAGATMTVRATNSLTSVLAENLLLTKVPAESNMNAPTIDAYVWLTGEPTGLKSATYTKAGVITITAEPDTAGGLTPKTITP